MMIFYDFLDHSPVDHSMYPTIRLPPPWRCRRRPPAPAPWRPTPSGPGRRRRPGCSATEASSGVAFVGRRRRSWERGVFIESNLVMIGHSVDDESFQIIQYDSWFLDIFLFRKQFLEQCLMDGLLIAASQTDLDLGLSAWMVRGALQWPVCDWQGWAEWIGWYYGVFWVVLAGKTPLGKTNLLIGQYGYGFDMDLIWMDKII